MSVIHPDPDKQLGFARDIIAIKNEPVPKDRLDWSCPVGGSDEPTII